MREDAGHGAGGLGPWGRTQQKVWGDGDEQSASPHLGTPARQSLEGAAT